MSKYLEYDVVIYLEKSQEEKQELEKLKEMGIPVSKEDQEKEEKTAKYSFDPSTIVEMRQTYVKFMGEFRDAVVVSFTKHIYETPPLLVTYEQFKKDLKVWHENNKEINGTH